MPFDGGEFSPFLPSEPLSSTPASVGVRARLTWLRCLLPGGREVQSLSPGYPDQVAEGQVACLLRSARALIEAEATWAQGAYRTADGRHCAVGALRAAMQGRYGRDTGAEAHRLLLVVARRRGFDSVEKMNDKSSHAEVLAAFDASIMSAGSL